MPSYLLQGFHREDHSMEAFMLVNKPGEMVESAFEGLVELDVDRLIRQLGLVVVVHRSLPQ